MLIRSSSLWGSGFSCRDSRSPSAFHVRNCKRTANPPVAAAAGSDRKLLLELRKVQDTSWGCEHEKVTLPCERNECKCEEGIRTRWSRGEVMEVKVKRADGSAGKKFTF